MVVFTPRHDVRRSRVVMLGPWLLEEII